MGFLSRLLGRNPSQDEFAKLILGPIRKAGVSENPEFDPDQFAVRLGPDDHFYLNNAYNDYCRAPWGEKQGVLEFYVASLNERGQNKIPEIFETGHDHYFPHLRCKTFFCINDLLFRARGIQDPIDTAHVDFAGDTAISLVVDMPHSVGSISTRMLQDWGKTFEEVLAVAQENLFRATSGYLEETGTGVYIAPWQDIYNGTRILLPHLFDGLQIKGDPVALIPTRETLIVTGSGDPAGILAAALISEQAADKGRALSAVPLVFREGRWNVLELEMDHPAFPKYRRMRLMELARDYSDQEEFLGQLEGENFYIAGFTVTQKKETQELCSYAVWSEGVPALIPVADRIAFVSEKKGDAAAYRWGDVLRVCGSMMEPCGLFPERYRVREFPDPSLFADLAREF